MDIEALYRSLPLTLPTAKSGSQIRLLKIGWVRDELRTNLKVFKLHQSPSYRALSYTWGDAKDPPLWRVNGVRFPVTRNLHAALEHLSVRYPDQWVWIDAICIDQSNEGLQEREHQVSLMRDIYHRADEVLVWLSGSTSRRNTRFLSTACREFATWTRLYIHMLGVTEIDYEAIGSKSIDLALESRPFSSKEADALLELLRHPYWNRVWM